MIYTITLNPAIDKAVTIDNFRVDEVNRVKTIQLDPGGKGINVSKMVKQLHGRSVAVMVTAGANGGLLQTMLRNENVVFKAIDCPGETRVNLKVFDPEKKTFTDINEPGPKVEAASIEAIDMYLKDVLRKNDIVTLSGSLPEGVAKDIYKHWCEVASVKGAKVILDADREALVKGLEGKPYMIKPNQDELEAYFGVTFSDDENMVQYTRTLIEKGIKIIVVSQGEEGCMLVTKDNVAKISPIDVTVKSTVGAGDSMVAGIAHGLEAAFEDGELLDFEKMIEIVTYGVASSSASIERAGTIMGEVERVNELYELVQVNQWVK